MEHLMENAQIEVQYYNPSSTKAPHNVKATDGKTYKFWPGSSADNVFNAQSVGKTYVVVELQGSWLPVAVASIFRVRRSCVHLSPLFFKMSASMLSIVAV